MNNEINDGGVTVPCLDLLAEIVTLRDEARAAQRDLIPTADPTGDARMAYGVVADRLDKIVAQAQNAESSGHEALRSDALLGVFVTAKLRGEDACRQGWVISSDPLRILGESGTEFDCEGEPTIVVNPPNASLSLPRGERG